MKITHILIIIIAVYLVVLLLYARHNIIRKSDNNESITNKVIYNEPIEFLYELPYMQQYDITGEKIKELNKMEEKYSYKGSVTKLCNKYGYSSYDSKDHYTPRLFYGVIFNHELDILQIALYEMIDVIYSFSIVEANSTFTGIPRKLKFPDLHNRLNSYYSQLSIKLNSKVTYAPWLQVNNNSYLSSIDTPLPNHAGYGREENIRNSILESWKKLGMSDEDIGIISDSDEFISEEFLHAIKNCDIFSDFKTNLKYLSLKDNCKRSKILSKSYIFSSNLDCPQRAQYGNRTDIFAGIRMNWHPDVIIGKCLLDESSNTTVENVRTRKGSKRLTKKFVGWHYRNIMTPEEVLYKYSTYAHPEESPLVMRYNLSESDPLSAKIDHVLLEKYDDCKYRSKILNESNFSTHNLPKLLQTPDGARQFKQFFHNMEEFYRIINFDILLLNDVISSYYMIKNGDKLMADEENADNEVNGTPTRRPRSGSLSNYLKKGPTLINFIAESSLVIITNEKKKKNDVDEIDSDCNSKNKGEILLKIFMNFVRIVGVPLIFEELCMYPYWSSKLLLVISDSNFESFSPSITTAINLIINKFKDGGILLVYKGFIPYFTASLIINYNHTFDLMNKFLYSSISMLPKTPSQQQIMAKKVVNSNQKSADSADNIMADSNNSSIDNDSSLLSISILKRTLSSMVAHPFLCLSVSMLYDKALNASNWVTALLTMIHRKGITSLFAGFRSSVIFGLIPYSPFYLFGIAETVTYRCMLGVGRLANDTTGGVLSVTKYILDNHGGFGKLLQYGFATCAHIVPSFASFLVMKGIFAYTLGPDTIRKTQIISRQKILHDYWKRKCNI